MNLRSDPAPGGGRTAQPADAPSPPGRTPGTSRCPPAWRVWGNGEPYRQRKGRRESRLFPRVLLQKVDSMIADGIRQVEVAGNLDPGIVQRQCCGCEVAPTPTQDPEVSVKTSLSRPVVRRPFRIHVSVQSQMPFPTHVGGVSRLLEDLGDGHIRMIQVSGVARTTEVGSRHPTHPRLVGVESP